MAIIDLDDFIRETECIYEGERYSVRDNGAVFRHQRPGKRVRSHDNQWTFGKVNLFNPYMHLAGVRIHRIVSTAFHGEPPNPQYVVDHIDTNCRNNRPENLRWVTRLENALMNPVTRKKIEFLCGSIEAFLGNPSMLNTYQREPNFTWMRTVTPEEAQHCKDRMSLWASTDKQPGRGSLGERIYGPIKKWEIFGREPGLDMALTKRCAQYMWGVPSYFPCCPEDIGTNPLEAYFQNLKIGAVLAYHDDTPKLMILEFVKIKNNSSILVMCEREGFMCEREGFKPWLIAEITFGNGFFVHSKDSYFEKSEADKEFCIKQE